MLGPGPMRTALWLLSKWVYARFLGKGADCKDQRVIFTKVSGNSRQPCPGMWVIQRVGKEIANS